MGDQTSRVLQLLGLLQSRTLWTGEELAERLRVTTRSVRRDVERLRALGYPVKASRGLGGGYQLGAGRALPPLLLDPEEAVAVAVSLSLAAGGTVSGVDQAALRAMAKLDQVLPERLRERVAAVRDATVTVARHTRAVEPDVLITLARACRDRVRTRLRYTAMDAEPTQRHIEPYRLVSLGQRWYLLAYDLDRDDWRSFRLDRMDEVVPTTLRFTPRPQPDAAEYVQRSVTRSAYRRMARVRLHAPAADLVDRVPATSGTLTPVDERTCVLETGAADLEYIALHLAGLGVELEVLDPPELGQVMERLGQRLLRASSSVPASASTT